MKLNWKKYRVRIEKEVRVDGKDTTSGMPEIRYNVPFLDPCEGQELTDKYDRLIAEVDGMTLKFQITKTRNEGEFNMMYLSGMNLFDFKKINGNAWQDLGTLFTIDSAKDNANKIMSGFARNMVSMLYPYTDTMLMYGELSHPEKTLNDNSYAPEVVYNNVK
jgi:hypothetical protein